MKQGAKVVCLLAGGLALTAFARGVTPETPLERHVTVMDNPYNAIVERNVFDLHDPPPPPEPKTTNAPPPNVHLTGIATVLGKKRAYFMLQSSPVPGRPSQGDRYMTLSEGQREDMLTVLEIDPKAKQVKISNSGNISTITFETNKIAFAGNPGGAAGNAAGRAGMAPAHLGNPPPGAPGYLPNSPSAIPPRPMRPSGTTDVGNSGGVYGNQAYNNYNNGYNPAGYNQTGYNQAYANAAGQGAQPAVPQHVDPDQQIVLMELQREATKGAVANGQLPPLPPTPLSQIMQQEQQQQNQQQNGAPAPNLPNFPGVHNSTGK